jgi:hypothetical protein
MLFQKRVSKFKSDKLVSNRITKVFKTLIELSQFMLRRTTMGGGAAQVQQLLVFQSTTTRHGMGVGGQQCNNSKITLRICNKNSENRQNSTEIHCKFAPKMSRHHIKAP